MQAPGGRPLANINRESSLQNNTEASLHRNSLHVADPSAAGGGRAGRGDQATPFEGGTSPEADLRRSPSGSIPGARNSSRSDGKAGEASCALAGQGGLPAAAAPVGVAAVQPGSLNSPLQALLNHRHSLLRQYGGGAPQRFPSLGGVSWAALRAAAAAASAAGREGGRQHQAAGARGGSSTLPAGGGGGGGGGGAGSGSFLNPYQLSPIMRREGNFHCLTASTTSTTSTAFNRSTTSSLRTEPLYDSAALRALLTARNRQRLQLLRARTAGGVDSVEGPFLSTWSQSGDYVSLCLGAMCRSAIVQKLNALKAQFNQR